MQLSFQHTEFLVGLILLLPLVLLFVYVLKWKRKVKHQFGDEHLIDALTADYSARNYLVKFALIIVAFALSVIGAANLRAPRQGSTGDRAGVDVMVALDVSNSMLAEDVKPSRLERAKQVLNRVIDRMGNNRMGLVVFAGQAYLQMPLTTDLAAAKMYVSNASPDAVPMQGTVVSDALKLCNQSLDNKERKHKAAILITDGETHDDNVNEMLKQLQENGVVVFTIGIGSPEGAPIFDPATNDYKKDENGNTVVSKLNEKDLQLIATETGGKYQLYRDADETVNTVLAYINSMEKKRIVGTGIRVYQSYFQWFLAVAFLLLLLETVIPERRMKWFSLRNK